MSPGETSSSYRLERVALELRCDDATAELGAELARYLPAALGDERAALAIALRAAPREPSPATRGWRQTCHFDAVQGFSRPAQLELWDGASTVRASAETRRIQAAIASDSDPQIVLGTLLFVALAFCLRELGLFHMHAGCVRSEQLGTILIPGESGAGKTTLTLGLLAAGARYLSDDAVFVCASDDDRDGAARVLGWARDFHVSSATLAAFPQLGGVATRRTLGGKSALPLDAWPGLERDARAATPDVILLPSVAHAPTTRVSALSKADALAALLAPSALLALDGAAQPQANLTLLERITRHAECRAIALGRDLLAEPAATLRRALG